MYFALVHLYKIDHALRKKLRECICHVPIVCESVAAEILCHHDLVHVCSSDVFEWLNVLAILPLFRHNSLSGYGVPRFQSEQPGGWADYMESLYEYAHVHVWTVPILLAGVCVGGCVCACVCVATLNCTWPRSRCVHGSETKIYVTHDSGVGL